MPPDILFPPLHAHKTKRQASSKQKTHPSTMCEHYSSSQPITASVSIKLKPIQPQFFSISLLFPMKPTCISFFPFPSCPRSLSFGQRLATFSIREIQPLISKVSRDMDHCCDLLYQRALVLPKIQFPYLVFFKILSF